MAENNNKWPEELGETLTEDEFDEARRRWRMYPKLVEALGEAIRDLVFYRDDFGYWYGEASYKEAEAVLKEAGEL